MSDRLERDTSTVLLVDGEKGELEATTPAGVVTCRAGTEVPVPDREGRPLGGLARPGAGDKVRVHHLVEEGARALEIDRE